MASRCILRNYESFFEPLMNKKLNGEKVSHCNKSRPDGAGEVDRVKESRAILFDNIVSNPTQFPHNIPKLLQPNALRLPMMLDLR